MAVAIDIGEAGNIHPKDKWDVGRRLAAIAMAKQYGSTGIAFSGPMYKSMIVQGSTVRLAFRNAQGMAARSGKLTGFEVAGADGKWAFADATVHGDTVWAGNPAVAAPVKARYGWANNPNCNLVNGAGLPASPFQTEGPQLPTALIAGGPARTTERHSPRSSAAHGSAPGTGAERRVPRFSIPGGPDHDAAGRRMLPLHACPASSCSPTSAPPTGSSGP
jgi:hypothetical protein